MTGRLYTVLVENRKHVFLYYLCHFRIFYFRTDSDFDSIHSLGFIHNNLPFHAEIVESLLPVCHTRFIPDNGSMSDLHSLLESFQSSPNSVVFVQPLELFLEPFPRILFLWPQMNIFVRKLRFKSSRELYHYTIVAFQIELDPKMTKLSRFLGQDELGPIYD